jgi:hypothetical protein
MGERYHLGGRVETDTVAMAAARQEQAGIQRRHRLERRHGDDPSQTPPFISLVARHEISQGTEEPPPQHPLQSAGPVLPINPGLLENRPRCGRPPLPDGELSQVTSCPRQTGSGRNIQAGFVQREKRVLLYEKWVNLQLNQDTVCHRCFLKDKDKEPFLMSDDNDMDPGEVPAHLPALSQVEEMLTARVHLHLEAKRIRGSILATPFAS